MLIYTSICQHCPCSQSLPLPCQRHKNIFIILYVSLTSLPRDSTSRSSRVHMRDPREDFIHSTHSSPRSLVYSYSLENARAALQMILQASALKQKWTE